MGQFCPIPVSKWIRDAYPAAITYEEAMQFAFFNMITDNKEDYPKHFEPALQRAMLYHIQMTKQ